MNRKEAAELSPFIKAFGEGRIIEFSSITDVSKAWREVTDFPIGMIKNFKFRIKPEPKFRPFKDAIECWTEMRKHKPFSILKDKKDGHPIQISSISDGINLIGSSPDSNFCFDFKYRMESCTFDDGAPFGVKVEN